MGLPTFQEPFDDRHDQAPMEVLHPKQVKALNTLIPEGCSRLSHVSTARSELPARHRLILFTPMETNTVTSVQNRESLSSFFDEVGVSTKTAHVSVLHGGEGMGRLLLACHRHDRQHDLEFLVDYEAFGQPQFDAILSKAEFDHTETLLHNIDWQAKSSCYILLPRWLSGLETLVGLAESNIA